VDCLLYCRHMSGSLPLSAGQGVVNALLGEDSFLDMSGSDWTDLGSGSHGSSVWNGRSGVTLIL